LGSVYLWKPAYEAFTGESASDSFTNWSVSWENVTLPEGTLLDVRSDGFMT